MVASATAAARMKGGLQIQIIARVPIRWLRSLVQQFALIGPPPVQRTRAGTDSTQEVTLINKSSLSTDKKSLSTTTRRPVCPHNNHGIRDDKGTCP
jgi:hypothetical protein